MDSKNKLFMKITFLMLAMTTVSLPSKAQSFEGDYGFFDHLGAPTGQPYVPAFHLCPR